MKDKVSQKQGTERRIADTKWLRERLLSCGMSQHDLAAEIGFHSSGLTRLFNADGETSLSNFLKIADRLGVSIEELLSRLGYTMPEGDKVKMLGTVLPDGTIRAPRQALFVSTAHVVDAIASVTFETGAGMDQAVLYLGRASLAENCLNSICLIDDEKGLRLRVVRWATSRDPGKYSLHPVPGTDAPIEDEVRLRSAQKSLWLRY